MAQSPATRDIGHEFSKYRLKEPLSDSFLGTRYRAVSAVAGTVRAASNAFGTDLSSWRSSAFALRLMRAETPSLIDRVARGAKAVRYVDHPCVLAPIQLIRAQTKLGVITQDIDGATLSDVMRLASARHEALPQSIALRIALDVLEGLSALHDAEGDVQRYMFACGGLTPDSIHIGSDGLTRLLDPGVAGAAAAVPHWGHDPVALAYTAPEQSGAEPRFNPGSDAFSVGVILWEMLAGEALFGAATAAETLERLHNGPIARVQRPQFVRGEPISAAVAQLVARALLRDPAQRFRTCDELAPVLRDAAQVGSHAAVAGYCHRLPSSSAHAFSDSDASELARRELEQHASFEVATGPLARIDSRDGDRSDSFNVTSDFEPATDRISAPILDLMLSAPHTETGQHGAQPLTAFPISDFMPVQEAPTSARRVRASIAIAAGVLLGLSYLAWQERGEQARSPSSSPERAAAARPATSDTPYAGDERMPTGPDTPGIVISRDEQVLSPNPPAAPTVVPADMEATIPVVTPIAFGAPSSAPDSAPPAESAARKPELTRRRATHQSTSSSPTTAPDPKFIPREL
jgi:serine/threonine protein kinase